MRTLMVKTALSLMLLIVSIGLSAQETEGVAFYHGKGCDYCFEGYRGRVGIYELLNVDDDVRNLILDRQPAHEIAALAIREKGLVTLPRDAASKVLQGVTTVEEAYKHTTGD